MKLIKSLFASPLKSIVLVVTLLSILHNGRLTAAPQSDSLGTATSDSVASAPQFDTGNDPTIVRKRLTFRNEYIRFGNGLGVNTTADARLFAASMLLGYRGSLVPGVP